MNLIITCARHLEPETKEELERILEELGDETPSITITEMPGILTVETTIEPTHFLENVKEKIQEEPWSIRYILRAIPIQKTTITNIENIVKECSNFRDKIKDEDTYRISIEKRHSNISSNEIISKVAEQIQKKVSLENPTWQILIEILGLKTGISLIHGKEIVSVEKLKRSISE